MAPNWNFIIDSSLIGTNFEKRTSRCDQGGSALLKTGLDKTDDSLSTKSHRKLQGKVPFIYYIQQRRVIALSSFTKLTNNMNVECTLCRYSVHGRRHSTGKVNCKRRLQNIQLLITPLHKRMTLLLSLGSANAPQQCFDYKFIASL